MRNSKLKSVAGLFAALAVIVSLELPTRSRAAGVAAAIWAGASVWGEVVFTRAVFTEPAVFTQGAASPTAMAMAGADMVGAATRGDIPTGATHIWVRSACSACNDLGPGRGLDV